MWIAILDIVAFLTLCAVIVRQCDQADQAEAELERRQRAWDRSRGEMSGPGTNRERIIP